MLRLGYLMLDRFTNVTLKHSRNGLVNECSYVGRAYSGADKGSRGGAHTETPNCGQLMVAVMNLEKDTSVASMAMLQCVSPAANLLD